ncbi:hypothetical protein [Microbacterium sp. Leaf179]|uniref:hypothetical protein n=1 Tax=Microbacterium sp. Leaf179 TaxID=1736288 RepID=UPI0006FCE940|nr:hypothetical protein [Microbacterium sp. Leaf179]KQR86518.1 hypothetical protein ASF96_09135 [Microbacterium sp. Leaf179]
MFTMLMQFVRHEAGKLSILAATTVEGASIVPKRGDKLVMRTTTLGEPDAELYPVDTVYPLISLDGFVVNFRFEPGEGDAPLHLGERRLRRDLAALGWTLVAPKRQLDFIHYDEEDYEGLERF